MLYIHILRNIETFFTTTESTMNSKIKAFSPQRSPEISFRQVIEYNREREIFK